jgi:opacity protein-like surface antigen
MQSKFLVVLFALVFSLPSFAQVRPAVEEHRADLSIGGGIDYWQGDFNHIERFGPSAWATIDLWRGIGINVEGHSMIAGGNSVAPRYKYYVGEGGIIYTFGYWHRFAPYAKAELGFASLDFPHKPNATYTHDTRNTWALGGGFEYKVVRRLWARVDYTYDGFPGFYSTVTGKHSTLDPAGLAVGATYHFR